MIKTYDVEIITGNYQLVYYVAEKCGNYRDTGIFKKDNKYILVLYSVFISKKVFIDLNIGFERNSDTMNEFYWNKYLISTHNKICTRDLTPN